MIPVINKLYKKTDKSIGRNDILRNNWKARPKKNAETKLDAGPAKDTMMLSRRGFLKLYGFIGTGFPQPKWAKIKHNAPKISICASGFNVSLPWSFAVGSPNLLAVQPWKYSWMVKAYKIVGIKTSSLFRFTDKSYLHFPKAFRNLNTTKICCQE